MESLEAWIPKDGNIRDVLENPKYPLPEGTNFDPRNMKAVANEVLRRKFSKVSKDAPPKPEYDTSKERFDIVVIGMQEATFEVEDPAKKLIPSTAIKAQRVVTDLTRGKNHLRKPKSTVSGENSLRKVIGTSLRQSAVKGDPLAEGASKSSSTSGLMPFNTSSSINDSMEGFSRSDSGLKSSEKVWQDLEQRKGQTSDTKVLHGMLKDHLPSYTHAVSYQRGQMRLLIFYNDEKISMEVISIKAQNTGKGGFANKGGIVSEVMVDGTTRLAFFTAHLEAHEGASKYETRCSSVADILRGTTSSATQCRCDASLASHFTFAMGDLNFRTKLPNHEFGSEAHIASTHAMAEMKDWAGIYKHDELSRAIQNNHCFSGFSTPVCTFPPTFKVERRKGYVYNEKRSPSYTDRILYNTGHRLREKLKVLAYEPIDDFATSDHKPIRGAFEVELNPKLKWRPTLL